MTMPTAIAPNFADKTVWTGIAFLPGGGTDHIDNM